jgi:hypothetical protein
LLTRRVKRLLSEVTNVALVWNFTNLFFYLGLAGYGRHGQNQYAPLSRRVLSGVLFSGEFYGKTLNG